MKEVVAALILWIGQNSIYDTTDTPPPQIVWLSPEELTNEVYSEMPELRPTDGVDERIWGLHNFEDGPRGTIYLVDAKYMAQAAPDRTIHILGAQVSVNEAMSKQPALANPVFQERLLHELVHYVQHQSGAYETFPCPKFGELEAYELGGKFLRQRNAQDPLPNRSFWARFYGRC